MSGFLRKVSVASALGVVALTATGCTPIFSLVAIGVG